MPSSDSDIASLDQYCDRTYSSKTKNIRHSTHRTDSEHLVSWQILASCSCNWSFEFYQIKFPLLEFRPPPRKLMTEIFRELREEGLFEALWEKEGGGEGGGLD